jgi:hypothetical protein
MHAQARHAQAGGENEVVRGRPGCNTVRIAKHSPWWRGATFYQVYVRSWRDSNGDGI